MQVSTLMMWNFNVPYLTKYDGTLVIFKLYDD